MKSQTNIVEHGIIKLNILLERALTNLFGEVMSEKPEEQLRNDANLDIGVPKIHQPFERFEHTTRK